MVTDVFAFLGSGPDRALLSQSNSLSPWTYHGEAILVLACITMPKGPAFQGSSKVAPEARRLCSNCAQSCVHQ